MAQQFYKIRARTLSEACKKMRATLGADARVVNTATVKQGGIFGMFTQNSVEITVSVPAVALKRSPTPLERRYEGAAAASAADGPASVADAKLRAMEQLLREAQLRINGGGAEPTAAASAKTAAPAVKTAPPRNAEAPAGRHFSARVDDEALPQLVVPPPAAAPIAAPAARRARDADHEMMKQELREMRELLQVMYAEHPEAGLPPETAPHYRHLVEQGLSRKTAAALIADAVRSSDPDLMRDPRIFRERLSFQLRKTIQTTDGIALRMNERRVAALCGATGVGKTTNLAKLAAQFALHRHARVALITMDTYRVAAPEQLRVYANIMGLPMRVCNDASDVAQAMRDFQQVDLILIDTAGGSQFNREQIQELQVMLQVAAPHEVLLVMAANTPLEDLRAVVENFGCLGPTAALFTKIDETRQYGVMTSLLIESELPLSYLSIGQNVPDDIRTATPAMAASLLLEGRIHRD